MATRSTLARCSWLTLITDEELDRGPAAPAKAVEEEPFGPVVSRFILLVLR
jgi:hypothetical protein